MWFDQKCGEQIENEIKQSFAFIFGQYQATQLNELGTE